jgi:hypothetical protein
MSTEKQYHDRAFLGKKEVVSNDFKNRYEKPVEAVRVGARLGVASRPCLDTGEPRLLGQKSNV